MADPITKDQAVQEVTYRDEEAQVVAFEMGLLRGDADDLGKSQQVFHQALGPAGADIDDDTLAATGELQAATSSVQTEAQSLASLAATCQAQLAAAREALGSHSRLCEAVASHPRAGKMDFYRAS